MTAVRALPSPLWRGSTGSGGLVVVPMALESGLPPCGLAGHPRRKGNAFTAILTTILLLLLALPAFAAADLPALSGRVVDDAGLLDQATRASLTAKLEAFEKKSSDQIVVATVPSLGGEEIEPYANRLFRTWALGQAKENNGVLLLVARDDRKMRIEVGYGLEGTLTDLHSKLIIENTLRPAFRAGDFAGGITKAVDDVMTVLEGNAAELESRYARNAKPAANGSPDLSTVLFVGFWILIICGGVIPPILAPVFGTRVGPNRYRWLGMIFSIAASSGGGWSSGGGGGGWSSGGGGGFSGGGGSSGGGGASGGW